MEMTSAVFGHNAWLLEVVWGYEKTGRGSVFFDFVWGNVSERYLNVYRILLDDHHVPEFFDLRFCHVSGVEEFEIGLEYIDGVVLEDRHFHIFDVVDS